MTTQLHQLPTGSQHKRLSKVLFFQAPVEGPRESSYVWLYLEVLSGLRGFFSSTALSTCCCFAEYL